MNEPNNNQINPPNHETYLKELGKCGKFVNDMRILNENDVLIIVDMQNDFVDFDNTNNSMEDETIEATFGGGQSHKKQEKTLQEVKNDPELGQGTFAVSDSKNMIINDFSKVINKFKDNDATIITTKDYHPQNHCSFINQGGNYPEHCVMGTKGAKIINSIFEEIKDYEKGLIFYKGIKSNIDSYSSLKYNNYTNEISKICGCTRSPQTKGCILSSWTGSFMLEGTNKVNIDNTQYNPNEEEINDFIDKCKGKSGYDYFKNPECRMLSLDDYLSEKPKGRIFVCGLAGDICVLDTAINAAHAGYETYIITDLIRIAWVPIIYGGEDNYVNSPKDFCDKIKNLNIKLIDSKLIEDEFTSMTFKFSKSRKRSVRKRSVRKRSVRKRSVRKRSVRKSRKRKRSVRKRSVRKSRKRKRSVRKRSVRKSRKRSARKRSARKKSKRKIIIEKNNDL